MSDLNVQVYYQGHLWDAPFTDDALPQDLTGNVCIWCEEDITANDDAVKLPFITAHLECHLRSALGDVQHLEGNCICYKSAEDAQTHDSDGYLNYRDGARATMRWLLAHHQGRFRP